MELDSSRAAFRVRTLPGLPKALMDKWDVQVTDVIAGGKEAAIELRPTVILEVRHLSYSPAPC